jgi:hypothetical protein
MNEPELVMGLGRIGIDLNGVLKHYYRFGNLAVEYVLPAPSQIPLPGLHWTFGIQIIKRSCRASNDQYGYN